MKQQLPVGVSDFRKLRENHFFYVDKSLFTSRVSPIFFNGFLFSTVSQSIPMGQSKARE